MKYICDLTGNYPAMHGLYFINYDFDGVVERTVDWWNKGALVTICRHCGADFADDYDDCKDDKIKDWNWF